MLQIRRILVPTDFSDAAEQALRYAVDLATKLGAEIHLVHAWQLSAYASPTSDLAKGMERDLSRDLAAVAQRYGAHGVTVHRHLRMGVPYVEIVEAAKDLGCDLVVIGTTGKTGLEHFLLGSVAERIVRTSEQPVLTVRYKPAAP
ncbi:universal stress protein [Sandaracinus amylolyticus]|uniref:Universal stress protein n=1 Tax=Sandaracinus amylolyticus TaxID=927083 RepID=A0A0F6W666_9BACT|nr:universal stress protein [Sandaracinus amylolyticus]AKF08506.1 Universal stress protein [Sandaracinus amylolyticus]